MSQGRLREALGAFLLVLFAALVCASPLVDPDMWWHLAAGREMLLHPHVPRAEAWSHTMTGAPWVDFEWLAQAALQLAYEAGGFTALVWGKAAACAAAVFLVYAGVRREESGVPAALLSALLALSALRLRAHARPELATFILAPGFLFIAREAARRGRVMPLWPLIPLSALWANLHGGWPLGPGIIACAAVGLAWQRRDAADADARRLGETAAACAAATLLNPYAFGLHAVMARHLFHPPSAAGIEEWSSEGLRHFPAFWLLLAGCAWRLRLDLARRRRETLFWLAVLAPMAVMGLSGARFAPYFCLTAPFYIFTGLDYAVRSLALDRGLALACAALGVSLTLPVLGRDFGQPVRWDRTPHDAVALLKTWRIPGPMFNDYVFGGYLDWQTSGSLKVYYDGRYLFQDLLAEVGRAKPNPILFAALMESRGVTHAVVGFPKELMSAGPDGKPLALPRSPWALRFPKETWALVHADDAALIYLRRTRAAAAIIARSELLYADPGDPDYVLAQVRAGLWAQADVERELRGLSRGGCRAAAALLTLLDK